MNSLGLTTLWCVVVVLGTLHCSYAQLDSSFYNVTCPNVHSIVSDVLSNVSESDPRMLASLIRVHFHDCFVQGCDASILLNDTATIVSEQTAAPNNNSLRGLDVVNQIKTAVENACPGIVSCADILALAAQTSSVLAKGPSWEVPLGRRDSLTANKTLADQNLPSPVFTLDQLIDAFANQNLTVTDLVALSGAHTIGKAHCNSFVDRLYNFNVSDNPDPTLNTTLLESLRAICPSGGVGTNLTDLDLTTPHTFDSKYYSNLQLQNGLLGSDQVLFSTADAETIPIVNSYIDNQTLFFEHFIASYNIAQSVVEVALKMEGRDEDVRVGTNRYGERQPIGTGAQTEDGKDYREAPPAPLFEPRELTSWSFYRAGIAEFVATFLFLYVTVLTVMGVAKSPNKCSTVGVQGIAWSFGGMIFALVYCTAGISGGHINPAVTFGLFLARKLSLTRTVFYMIMQCLGAICGAAVVKGFQSNQYERLGGGANTLSKGYSKGDGLGAEIVGTFILVYTVFSATDAKRNARDSHVPILAPLPIGFAVFLVHLATIPITGTGINPARSLGAALIYNKDQAWDNHWIFWVGPFIGAALAALYHQIVLRAIPFKSK